MKNRVIKENQTLTFQSSPSTIITGTEISEETQKKLTCSRRFLKLACQKEERRFTAVKKSRIHQRKSRPSTLNDAPNVTLKKN
jgi:hypothetical protein